MRLGLVLSIAGAAACTTSKMVPTTDSHADHAAPAATMPVAAPNDPRLPADASGALARLSASPRHGEYAIVHTGGGDSVRVWVVYPERSTKAPVVVVVHEIFGLSSWVRGVAA
jgi:carboxymethylenebutenolidase